MRAGGAPSSPRLHSLAALVFGLVPAPLMDWATRSVLAAVR
jgi:hypothetical protein